MRRTLVQQIRYAAITIQPAFTVFTRFATYLQQLSLWQKIKYSIGLVLLLWFWLALPAKLFNKPACFVITAADGSLLNASIAADGQWRFPATDTVPEKFAQCITAFEDKRFWYHPGVDPIAIVRAIKQNVKGGKTVSGGSTLTMQVIRLYKQNNQRSIWNKLGESILAIRLECSYNKRSILAMYASNAPFGSNVVGLDAAAWRYYGRNAAQLSWGEMAALAVLPNAPSLVHPGKNTAILLRKRNELLQKLVANNTITAQTAELAALEPLPGEPKALPQLAPHLLDRFRKDYTAHADAYNYRPAVQTTINSHLQQQLNDMVALHSSQLKGNQIRNAAAMVVEVETGNILAYVGNVYNPANADAESHVDVLNAPRSPGSTLKPLLYAALLTEGSMLPNQLIADIPTQIGGYTPQNFDLGYDGAVPANRALARSLNIPAVKMLQQYKYARFYDVLKQCGFTTLNRPADHYGMSLILGGCEVTPFQLAGVYSSMARMYNHQRTNNGAWNAADWFMPSYTGTAAKSSKAAQSPLFSYTALWHTFNAMNEVMRPGEEGLWGLFGSAQRVAWKTGTSFGFRDGWAIGITPKYCVVVWIGNTTGEGRPELTGINTAAPLLFNIFRVLPVSNWFEAPAYGFNYIPVCKQSGYKAGPDCAATTLALTDQAAKNAPTCPYCRIVHLDATGTWRVNESCEAPSAMQHQSYFVLPPTMEYYYRNSHPGYKVLPAYKPGCAIEASKALDVIYPEDNARIYVPKEITGNKGKTIFTATHRSRNAKLFWHVDEVYVTTTQQFHQLAINPQPGMHTLTVIDEDGNSITRRFEIVSEP